MSKNLATRLSRVSDPKYEDTNPKFDTSNTAFNGVFEKDFYGQYDNPLLFDLVFIQIHNT
jgi:hypothetical protein